MNFQSDSDVGTPLDLQNFARKAVAYCITQTASRHAGRHVLLGTFPNTQDGLAQQARLAKLTYDELCDLNQNERFDRFRDAFLNDVDVKSVHSLFIKLNNNFPLDMEKHLEECWKAEEERLIGFIDNDINIEKYDSMGTDKKDKYSVFEYVINRFIPNKR